MFNREEGYPFVPPIGSDDPAFRAHDALESEPASMPEHDRSILVAVLVEYDAGGRAGQQSPLRLKFAIKQLQRTLLARQ